MSDIWQISLMTQKGRFTFRVPENIGNGIRAYCAQEDITPSQVFRKALKKVIPEDFFKSLPKSERKNGITRNPTKK